MNSKEEKRNAFLEHGRHEAWVYVSELRDFLKGFPDDAWLLANDLGNLNVYIEEKWVATIDLHQNIIAWWDEE